MTRFFMKMKQRRSFMRCVKTTICIRQMLRRGKIELIADCNGLLKVDKEKIEKGEQLR